MKIGVFGDSYCEKSYYEFHNPVIWYNFLKEQGHSIECWGESGSSMYFSACQIAEKNKDYDLVIWCVTTPGRLSLKTGERWHHICTADDRYRGNDIEVQKKHNVYTEYRKWVFDWEQSNFIDRCVVEKIAERAGNVLLIPCFPPPLGAEKFNLYTLCELEAQHWFPEKTIPEIYKDYQDLRPGHISIDNQKILYKLISENLKPGIFSANYADFQPPTISVNQAFRKL